MTPVSIASIIEPRIVGHPNAAPVAAREASGTVVVVHGLNIAPRVMEQVATEFSARGKRVLLVGLTGHRDTDAAAERRSVNAEQWKLDVRQAIEHGAMFPGPLWVLGYSLGGLLSTAVLQAGVSAKVERLILLAPAIGLRVWARSGEPLARLVPTWFPLRSGVPKRYRATTDVGAHWYRALFDLLHEVQGRASAGLLKEVCIRVYMSKWDEFISWTNLSAWVARMQFDDVQMHAIESHSKDLLIPNHLVLDQSCLGKKPWEDMIKSMCAKSEREAQR